MERPTFRPFDPDGPGHIYYHSLPHWRQPGSTYFVTFRLADSIPERVLAAWADNRLRWYRAHGLTEQMKRNNPDDFWRRYSAIPERVRYAFEKKQARQLHLELDECHGTCLLRNNAPRQILANSLLHFHGQRVWTGDWVIMPNHVHILLSPFGNAQLENLIGSIKRWSARLIGQWDSDRGSPQNRESSQNQKPHFWQVGSYDRIVRDQEELLASRRYIADNPQKAKLSQNEFTYHRAAWLEEYAPLGQ